MGRLFKTFFAYFNILFCLPALIVLINTPIYGLDSVGQNEKALIGTWSAEWGDLHYASRSITLKEDGTFTDNSTKRMGKRSPIKTEYSGKWETIEGCILKLSPTEADHYFLYYRIEKGILCYFSSSTLLRATEDGKLTGEGKSYRRSGRAGKDETTIDGMWIDESTGSMAFSFYKNGSFVRRRLSNKPEQWSQIGYEFLLWDSAKHFIKMN